MTAKGAFRDEDITRFAQAVGETGPDRYYVYMLCGKDGFPFYIGKGQGCRVFAHMKNAMDAKFYIDRDETLSKAERAARLAALRPKLVRLLEEGESYTPKIVKWGLTENEAFMAESASINLAADMLAATGRPPLTNIANGHASAREKSCPADIKTCTREMSLFLSECAPPIVDIDVFSGKKTAFIALGWNFYSRCFGEDGRLDLFKVGECARGMWRIGQKNGKAASVEYIVALHKLRVIGIFKVKQPARPVSIERAEGLKEFPVFPEDIRRMDYMKCAFGSLAAAKAGLTSSDYCDLVADLAKNNPKIPTADAYMKLQNSRIYFRIDYDISAEIAKYAGCVLVSSKLGNKLIKRFQRNPVYLNF